LKAAISSAGPDRQPPIHRRDSVVSRRAPWGVILVALAVVGSSSSHAAQAPASAQVQPQAQPQSQAPTPTPTRHRHRHRHPHPQGIPPRLYNLANAYARAGKPGLAVLNYERAKLLEPNDPISTPTCAMFVKRSGCRRNPATDSSAWPKSRVRESLPGWEYWGY